MSKVLLALHVFGFHIIAWPILNTGVIEPRGILESHLLAILGKRCQRRSRFPREHTVYGIPSSIIRVIFYTVKEVAGW